VAIDPIPLPEDRARHQRLEAALKDPTIDRSTRRSIAILPANALAYMKLGSARPKDRGDIVAMVAAGTVEFEVLDEWVLGDAELMRALARVREELDTDE
jgi:hypothetical protein